MKNVVIAGSARLREVNEKWVDFWKRQEGFVVTNYPLQIPSESFLQDYPRVHKEFFESLKNADLLFVANEEKNGIPGYIGAEVFAEIVFVIALNLTEGKKIEIQLATMPSEKIQAYEEIQLWLGLGWVKLFHPVS